MLGILPEIVLAQSSLFKNEIQATVSNFYVPAGVEEKMFKPFMRSLGIAYTYAFTDRVEVQTTLTLWFNTYRFSPFKRTLGNGYYETTGWRKGVVKNRFDYNLVDINCNYNLMQTPRQTIYLGTGVSYCKGKNTVTESIVQIPGAMDYLIEVREETKSYFGMVAKVGYQFYPFKRIGIGVSETVRKYSSLPTQFYTDVRIGYRFGLRKL